MGIKQSTKSLEKSFYVSNAILDIKISMILVKKGLAVSFSIEYKLSNYVERFIVHRLPLNIITYIFMCMHIEWLAKCNVSFLP